MTARLGLGLALLLLVVPAAAQAGADGARLAGALQRDPVVVDPGAAKRLPAREQGPVRIRIVQRDVGRVKIVVTTKRVANRTGGTAGLASAIAAALPLRGALLVVAGNEWRVITSYPYAPTLRAVQTV